MFKRRGRKPAGILVLVLMLSTLLAACGGGTTSGGASGENTDNGSAQQNEGSTTTALSGTIEIDGSSTLHPLTEAIAEEFGAKNPDVRIPIGTGGTGGGFKRFNNGEIPISNASRPIKDSEAEEAKSKGITYHEVLVAYDGLSVVVNPSNEFVDKLTVDELKKIYEPNSTVKHGLTFAKDGRQRKSKFTLLVQTTEHSTTSQKRLTVKRKQAETIAKSRSVPIQTQSYKGLLATRTPSDTSDSPSMKRTKTN